jgi:Transposase DDE domain
VVKRPKAKKGFVLLPRLWVVERSFGWAARVRRLARDYERLPATLAGLHFLMFAILLFKRFVELMVQRASHALEHPEDMDLQRQSQETCGQLMAQMAAAI